MLKNIYRIRTQNDYEQAKYHWEVHKLKAMSHSHFPVLKKLETKDPFNRTQNIVETKVYSRLSYSLLSEGWK